MTCRFRAAGPAVITDLRIEGFRGFRDIHIGDLRRINIIVGDSASGKTSLLEALVALGGLQTDFPQRFWEWRNVTPAGLNFPFEPVILDLFHDHQGEVSIGCTGDDGHDRALVIKLQDWFHRSALYDQRPNRNLPFLLEWIGTENEQATHRNAQLAVNEGSLRYLEFPVTQESRFIDTFPGAVFTLYLSERQPGYELATMFNELKTTGEIDNVLSPVTQAYGFAEIIHGQDVRNVPMLFAREVGKSMSFPITSVSSGLMTTLRYFLILNWLSKAVVVIDEIENGIFHARQEFMWSKLREYAVAKDHQLFVTTHSMECLRNAAKIAKEFPEEFSLIRTTHEGIHSTVEHFSGEQFSKTVAAGLEVR